MGPRYLSPSQVLYNEIFKACKQVNKNTFDYIELQDEYLPFIRVGETYQTDNSHIDLNGSIEVMIYLYGYLEHRLELDNEISELHNRLLEIYNTRGYKFKLRNFEVNTIPTNEQERMYLMKRIRVEYDYNK